MIGILIRKSIYKRRRHNKRRRNYSQINLEEIDSEEILNLILQYETKLSQKCIYNELKHNKSKLLKPHYVYILLCKNKRIYVGMTYDLRFRYKQHCRGRGAQYTKKYGIERLLYSEEVSNRFEALVREKEIKKEIEKYSDVEDLSINYNIQQDKILDNF